MHVQRNEDRKMPAHSLKMLIRCGLQIAVMFEEISWEAPLAAVLGE
jgi:hypothetical protein